MNALNLKVLTLLNNTLQDLGQDEQVRAVVLTGSGQKAFCAGLDLKEIPLSPEQKFAEYITDLGRFQEITMRLRNLETPVIAAVNGYAIGAGCDLALACDLRLSNKAAVFQEGFVNVGLIPGDGGAYLLPRIVGESIAKDMIFTGRRVKAEEALEIGLVSEVISENQLMEVAKEKSKSLAAGPTVALGKAKQLINESYQTDFQTALEHAAIAQRICSQTKDHKEALDAFNENREPEFRGE